MPSCAQLALGSFVQLHCITTDARPPSSDLLEGSALEGFRGRPAVLYSPTALPVAVVDVAGSADTGDAGSSTKRIVAAMPCVFDVCTHIRGSNAAIAGAVRSISTT